MANLITLIRIGLLLIGVGLIYSHSVKSNLVALAIILVVILMDWLDGMVARQRGRADDVGAVVDILGDRIVENVLWIVFAHIGLLPIWVPLVVFIRGSVTDTVRSIALTQGQTPFGKRTMMRTAIGRWVVASRTSRALYAAAKFITFGYLILLLSFQRAQEQGWELGPFDEIGPLIHQVGMGLAYFTVAFCLFRGIPVILDGRHYFYQR
jgi:CDP-diacylglycerol---glycerol-3-phosphate 3-phosphatidyltransferase